MSLLIAIAAAQSMPEVSWDWEQRHRFLVEAQVQLPQRLWFEAEINRAVRAVGWQIQAVLDCAGTGVGNERRTEVSCRIEDIALRGAMVLGDQGRALPVLEEYDRVLTGSELVLDFRPDGRVAAYEVQVPTRNLRTRGRKQTLRLVLRSIVVGLEVQLPQRGVSPWLFKESQLCQVPTLWGTLAPVEGISVGKLRQENVLEIASSAKGLMSPGENENLITCDIAERAFFTLGRGVARHSWEMHGDLTPGSPGAMGVHTVPFTQRGQLVRLKADEAPALFATEEYQPDRLPSGALQDGLPPPPSMRR